MVNKPTIGIFTQYNSSVTDQEGEWTAWASAPGADREYLETGDTEKAALMHLAHSLFSDLRELQASTRPPGPPQPPRIPGHSQGS